MVAELGRLRLGITLGDPLGIGPEIVAKSLVHLTNPGHKWLIFGDFSLLEKEFAALGHAIPDWLEWPLHRRLPAPDTAPSRAAAKTLHSAQSVVAAGANIARPLPPEDLLWAGQRQLAYLEAAAEFAQRGELDALITAPINKTAIKRAGFSFAGHTEFLAHRLNAQRVVMMFAGPKLRVSLVTIHEPLSRVASSLSEERIAWCAQLTLEALQRDFAIARPRIGVLGLNPHAGEQGHIGDEELRIIAPAISAVNQSVGREVLFGPLVPDAAYRCDFDAYIAMYHDQALIPVKLLDFEESVNVTLGLPIVRTSPDHGTAYDIAGKGIARATSMQCAITMAISLATARKAIT